MEEGARHRRVEDARLAWQGIGEARGGAVVVGRHAVVPRHHYIAVADPESVAQGLRERIDDAEVETGANLAGVFVAGAAGLAERKVVAVGVERELQTDLAFGVLEGGAADHVDRAAHGVGAVRRERYLADFDASDADGAGLGEAGSAIIFAGVGKHGSFAEAVGRDFDGVGTEAADGEADDVAPLIFDADAGEVFDEFADVVPGDLTHGVSRGDALEVTGIALLVGGDGLGVDLAGGAHAKLVQLHGRAVGGDGGAERDVEFGTLAGDEIHGHFLSREICERDDERHGAGREAID